MPLLVWSRLDCPLDWLCVCVCVCVWERDRGGGRDTWVQRDRWASSLNLVKKQSLIYSRHWIRGSGRRCIPTTCLTDDCIAAQLDEDILSSWPLIGFSISVPWFCLKVLLRTVLFSVLTSPLTSSIIIWYGPIWSQHCLQLANNACTLLHTILHIYRH